MNPLTYLKLGLLALVVFTIGLLSWETHHYKSKYEEAQQAVAAKQVELDQALASIKDVNAKVEELKKQTDEKQEVVKKAQDQAALLAKNNQKLSDKILSAQPTDPNKCVAAVNLFKQYKKETSGK